MLVVAKIDDQEITSDDLVKLLKFNGKFDNVLEEIVVDKLTVAAAKKKGVDVSLDEIQARVDQLRRIQGLHRAKDTLEFLEGLGLSIEEFQDMIADDLYKEKMVEAVVTDKAEKEYFSLHSPKFDTVEISQIVVNSESKAKELMAALEDDSDAFADLAKEHSLDSETRDKGGLVGNIMRGSLRPEVESKVFNANAGDVLGPFESEDGIVYELFKVHDKKPASLDESTSKQVRKLVFDDWLEARGQEHNVEVI